MLSESSYSPISRLLWLVTAFESAVLVVAGGGLFFLPEPFGQVWPWELTPFNARFLGAVYLASLLSTLLLVVANRWSPARVVVPMIFLFTIIVLAVSVLNLSRFTGPLFATVLWFLLYVGIPLNAGYHLWLYRDRPVHDPLPLSSAWRMLLLVQAVVFGVYGLALLLAPAVAGSFWPWPVDDFHGRMYSVAFLTPALGAWLCWRASAALELRTLGVTQLVGGVLSVAGLLIVDLGVQRVDWTAAGTWLWLALFIFLALGGLVLVSTRDVAVPLARPP